ncbi:PilZ domain-containing protein [Geomonas sp. RF6]|uniref:PilZ domain-containing protein n=1 Tax=Geomonas sp. RF6 TaxID=2897342 RepID=UPI001E5D5795|nr:PilZ domain-containing protein [Geomonas sp. RF6]UFS71245.1 PilZ domain-containing protein [Geomonas sp. RF6]
MNVPHQHPRGREERRKFPRFCASEGATAAFTAPHDDSHYTFLGRIVDISQGGLAFEYEGRANDLKLGILDILGLASPYLLLHDVPFNLVYHRKVDSGDSAPAMTRRCALTFGQFSHEQAQTFREVMAEYAMLPAN